MSYIYRNKDNKDKALFISHEDSNKIGIQLGTNFRDIGWDSEFGTIQQHLRNTSAVELHILLDNCIWADPGPLLSLAISAAEWREVGKKLILHLPNLDKIIPVQKRFLAFLVKEGFLDSFLSCEGEINNKNAKVFLGNNNVTSNINKVRNILLSLTHYVAYQSATCMPAKIINLSKISDISIVLESLIDQAKLYGLKRHFDRRIFQKGHFKDADPIHITQELRQVLLELLRNIDEHAYTNEFFKNKNKYAGIYVRIRYGYSDGRKIDRKFKLKNFYASEEKYCPQLEYCPHLQQIGFIEAFVSDSGVGVAHHFSKIKKEKKHPLKSFFVKMTTDDAFSRYSKEERRLKYKSPMPGLKFITEMLGARRSYLRFLHRFEWCGASFPLEKTGKILSKISKSVNLQEGKSTIKGTHILARISAGSPIGLPKGWKAAVLADINSLSKCKIYKIYNSFEKPPSNLGKACFYIYDDQTARLEFKRYADEKILKIGNRGKEKRIVLWRPAKSLLRDEIPQRLFAITEKKGSIDVIIADQDLSSALMTIWALNNSYTIRYKNINRISVITDNLCGSDVVSRGRKFLQAQSSLLFGDKNNIGIDSLLWALREIDSEFYWKTVEDKDASKDIFIKDKIKWQSETDIDSHHYLNSFIDFIHSINDKRCRWVYRRSLSRFLAYTSPQKRPYTIDHVVDSLIGYFYYHSNYEYEKLKSPQALKGNHVSDDRPIVLLGSVLVSGETALAIDKEWQGIHIDSKSVVAHFFAHEDLKVDKNKLKNYVWLLRWIPKDFESDRTSITELKKQRKKSVFLERIVDSPMIGVDGNLKWKMVRTLLDEKGKKVSLYGSSPQNPNGILTSDAYLHWQSRGLLRFGHWSDANHHDCLGLNTLEALRSDFSIMSGPVWDYLFDHINRLSPEYKDNSDFPKCHILACVANEGTLFVVDQFSRIFPWLRDKVILLPLIQRRRKAMRLRISTIDTLRLREKVTSIKDKKGRANVLLFDICISSIRTYLELQNLIKANGADEIFSITLIDRSRLPNHEELAKEDQRKKDSRLWRLDLDYLAPTEGPNYSAGCPLCEGLEIISKDIDSGMVHLVINRLREWKEITKLRRLSISSPLMGIQSEKLEKPTIINFGVKRTINNEISYDDQIRIEKSTSLATILIELITITGRHDLITKFTNIIDKEFSKDDDNNIQTVSKIKIELLLSQLIYMRSDIGYRRKLLICKELLKAVHESPDATTATAFACLILYSIDTNLAKGLINEIYEILLNDKIGTNLDFIIISSKIVNLSGIKMIDKIENIKKKNFLKSIVPISKPLEKALPRSITELFLIIGSRPGHAHITMLRGCLEIGNYTIKKLNNVLYLIQRLSDIFKQIKEQPFMLPIDVSINTIDNTLLFLNKLQSRLELKIGKTIEDNELNEIYEYLRKYFYGGGADRAEGLAQNVNRWFTKGYNQLYDYIKKIVEERGKIDANGLLFSPPMYVDNIMNSRIRTFNLRPIEDCLFEIIYNAFIYHKGKYDNEYFALCSTKLNSIDNSTYEIVIEITNKIQEGQQINVLKTYNVNFVENLGGEIIQKRKNADEFKVIVKLPLLDAILSSL